MPYTEASKRATIKYRKEHLKVVNMTMKKEDYNELKEYADSKGKGVSTVIKEAIKEKIAKG